MHEIERKNFRFAEFEVDVIHRKILRDGMPVKLNDKAFDLLVFLIVNNGKIIGKDEILGNVWEGNLIEENNLTVQISKIRKIFNETKDNPRFLQTITGRGYCFSANVSEVAGTQNGFQAQNDISKNDKNTEKRQSAAPSKTKKTLSILPIILVLSLCIGLLATFLISKNNTPFENSLPEKLTTSSQIENLAISPDGKYFAFVQNEAKGQTLNIQQTNFSNHIQINPGSNMRYWGLTFSPDGNEIYYSAFAENNPDIALYRIPILGGKPEKVLTDVGASISFSPNGDKIAFTTSIASQKKTFLKIADADGSNEKILSERNSSTGFKIRGKGISWSPKEDLIAAIVETGDEEHLIGINTNNGEIQTINDKRWAKIKDVAWLKDGIGLVVTANEKTSDPTQIWFISYPGEQIYQITKDSESYENLSIAADNTIVATKNNQNGYLSIAPEADYIENVETIINQSDGFKDFVWTSENELAFISGNNIWKINDNGSEKKQLTQNAQIRQRLDFSESENYFVFDSLTSGKVNLWRADADGNNLRRITNGDGESFPSISQDGSFIVYQNGVTGGTAGVWKIDSDGSNIKEIRSNSGTRPQISPDGKLIAFFIMDNVSETEQLWKIGILSIEKGEIIQKIEIPPSSTQRFLRWTNDGKAIAYIDDKGNESSIILQPLNQSKTLIKFKTTAGKIVSFGWSPDGRKVAVNTSNEIRETVLIKDR